MAIKAIGRVLLWYFVPLFKIFPDIESHWRVDENNNINIYCSSCWSELNFWNNLLLTEKLFEGKLRSDNQKVYLRYESGLFCQRQLQSQANKKTCLLYVIERHIDQGDEILIQTILISDPSSSFL